MEKIKLKFSLLLSAVVLLKFVIRASAQAQYDHVLAAFPSNETNKNLIITHRPHYLFHTLHVQCNTFDALNHLVNYRFVTEFYSQFELYFDGCFRDDTSPNTTYDNYKFNLINLIRNFKIFLNWNQLIIKFSARANIDETIFFDRINVTQFSDKIKLINTNFVDKKFLKFLYPHLTQLHLENVRDINLNHFNANNISELIIQNNTVFSLRRKNLKKFENLKKLTIKNFAITTNFSAKRKLFKLNKSLVELRLINFINDRRFKKIVLNNKLFYGLTSLEYLELRNLKLERVPSKLFYDLNSIVDISVADNNIRSLHLHLFRYNEYLKRIDLSGNTILFISGCNSLIERTCLASSIITHSLNQNNTNLERPGDRCNLQFSGSGISVYLDEDRIKNRNLVENLQKIKNIENIYLGHQNLYE